VRVIVAAVKGGAIGVSAGKGIVDDLAATIKAGSVACAATRHETRIGHVVAGSLGRGRGDQGANDQRRPFGHKASGGNVAWGRCGRKHRKCPCQQKRAPVRRIQLKASRTRV